MATLPNSALFLYTGTVAFIAGVLLYSFFDLGLAFPVALIGIAGTLLACVSLGAIDRCAIVAIIALAAVSLGCVRIALVPDVAAPLAQHLGGFVVIEGDVAQDPQRRARGVHVVVEAHRIDGRDASGRVLVFAERGERARYGDAVVVRGQLLAPEPFETETGAQFDYPGYLAAKGIGAVVFRPTIEVSAPAAGASLLGGLYGLKARIKAAAERVFPEPAAGLLLGMILGEDALPERITEVFRRSSLVHIVVLSGYNLTIVALALMSLLTLVPRVSDRARLAVGALSIILFAAMVGFGATVLRATLMALIALLAQALRRPKAALRALMVAAAAMVLHNPLVLAHDPSFVLSFLATFGLITLSPYVSSKLTRVPEAYSLREIASATVATQVFILPALIFYTGTLSLVSLPANMLALPLVPPAMLFGALTSGVALFSNALALPLMLPAYLLLSAIIAIATVSAAIPGSSIAVAALQTPLIFALYAFLVPLALYTMHRHTFVHGSKGDERFRVPFLRAEAARAEAQ